MKLKNKKTGEIGKPTFISVDYEIAVLPDDKSKTAYYYSSLSELNKEWEDYEESKEHYFITEYGGVFSLNEYGGLNNVANLEDYREIGNYFETKEEAEKAVEKLKAYKRLRDKGFRFNGWDGTRIGSNISYISEVYYEGCADDMDLLFGGEE